MKGRNWLILLSVSLGLLLACALLVMMENRAVAGMPSLESIKEDGGKGRGLSNRIQAEIHVCPAGPPSCDYAMIQDAVDAAVDGDLIKVATGVYTDVHSRTPPPGYMGPSVITQVVYITKQVTIRGGYTTSDWSSSDPEANQTILDAQGRGRGVVVAGLPTIQPRLEGLHITGGDATGLGGGLWDSYDGTGGGVYVVSATVTISTCEVYSNVASRAGWAGGGGLYLLGTSSTVAESSIYSNTAGTAVMSPSLSGEGGGAVLARSDALLLNNLFRANVASSADYAIGGGLYMEEGTPTLRGNIFQWNSACLMGEGNGGGIFNGYHNDALLVNNVLVENFSGVTPSSSGAGLFVEIASPRLLHTTVSNNSGGDGSGIFITGFAPGLTSNVEMTNTIVVGHLVGVYVEVDNGAYLMNVLWFNNESNTGGTGNISPVNELVADPVFSPDDYHLLPGSAALEWAVDQGVTHDVDGQPRPFGPGPDVGADELSVVSGTIPPGGGSVVYTDAQGLTTTVKVPSGALTESVMLALIPFEEPGLPIPPARRFAGRAFDLDAYRQGQHLPGFGFAEPVPIALRYSDMDVAGIDENELRLYYWTGNGWMDVADTCTPPSLYIREPQSNLLKIAICHLSRYSMQGMPVGGGEFPYSLYLPLIVRP